MCKKRGWLSLSFVVVSELLPLHITESSVSSIHKYQAQEVYLLLLLDDHKTFFDDDYLYQK